VLIAEIPLDDWRVVVKHKLEAVILDVCLNGKDAITAIINAYRGNAYERTKFSYGKGKTIFGLARRKARGIWTTALPTAPDGRHGQPCGFGSSPQPTFGKSLSFLKQENRDG
jgi:hypothetical protein